MRDYKHCINPASLTYKRARALRRLGTHWSLHAHSTFMPKDQYLLATWLQTRQGANRQISGI